MIPTDWFKQAEKRIAPYIVCTPLSHDNDLGIYFKWENKQVTGSFKARGALNKVLSLETWEQNRGLVTASAGNHGAGVALAGRLVDTRVMVFASDHAVPEKLAAMIDLGAEIHTVKGGYGLAEASAIQHAAEKDAIFISAYNDGQIIAGQGTIAQEILDAMGPTEVKSWVVPVGGGGLISGIGCIVAESRIKSRLIGVQPEASAFTHALFHSGSQNNVLDLPTLADGLSGPMQEGSITLPILNDLVDDILTVSEAEIEQAIAFSWQKYHEVIEGSAATALAAVLFKKVEKPVVVVISGGNISPATHHEIIGRVKV